MGGRVAVRLSPDLLELVDAQARAVGESRAGAIRRLLAEALDRPPPDGVDRAQIRRMLALSPSDRIRQARDVVNAMRRLRGAAREGAG